MSSQESIDEMTEFMKRLERTDDVEAVFYLGGLDMLRSLWLDGGTAADVAVEKFRAERGAWLEEWVIEREVGRRKDS